EGGVEAVAEGQEFNRVEGSFGDSLLHLDSAGAAFGRADFDVVAFEPLVQLAAGSERGSEVVFAQAVGPAHARAASVEELGVEAGNLVQKLEAGQADPKGAQVAGLVVSDP